MIRWLGHVGGVWKVGGVGLMALMLGAICAGSVYAAGPQGRTYFENAIAKSSDMIGPRVLGSDSLYGSVLPNYTGWGDGSGAIGDTIMNQKTPANVSRKEKFYNLLYWQYTQGNAWEKAGSAQIALSLLGFGFGEHTGNRTVTDAQWKDLRARLVDNTDLEMIWRGTAEGNGVSRRDNTAGVYVNSQYDSVRWDNGDDLSVDAWQFRSRSSGTSYAILEIACGNGIGDVNALPQPARWETDAWSLVGMGNANPNVNEWPADPPRGERPAQPGDRLYWRHGLYNDGPSSTGTLSFWIGKGGFSNGWNSVRLPEGSFSLTNKQTRTIGYGVVNWDDYSIYDVTQDDVGNTLCQGLNWSPRNQDGGSGSSDPACVAVPYNFKLTPRADTPTKAAESGASVTITPSIENSGPTKSYDDSRWQLSRFILASGAAIPGDGESGNACAPSWSRCSKLSEGSGTFSPGTTTLATNTYVVEDLALGTRVCFALSVNKFSASRGTGKTASNWWNGVPDCMVVGKKPKVQVWGDDVAVRGDIKTSTTKKSDKMFGSWVEYGALSVGQNTQFASGAGLVEQTSDLQRDWSKLTFANSNTPGGVFGRYTASSSVFRPQPLIARYFSAGKPTTSYDKARSMDENAFATGDSVVVRTTDNLDLTAGTLPKGRSLIIVASGTVTIKGNLDYANGAMTSVRDIPQLVIIADKIDIEANVTNVDAWLVTANATTGVINTCSDLVGNLSGKVCDKQLTVHGPVLAGKLLLKRTAGSGTGAESDDPAELFNTRPDAHLWAQLVAASSGRAETVDVVELPPRF